MHRRRVAVAALAVAVTGAPGTATAAGAAPAARRVTLSVDLHTPARVTACRAVTLTTKGTRLRAAHDKVLAWTFDAGDRTAHAHGSRLVGFLGHTWRVPGRYTATFSVKDRFGTQRSRRTVIVTACPPSTPLPTSAPTPAAPPGQALRAVDLAGAIDAAGGAAQVVDGGPLETLRLTAPVPAWIAWTARPVTIDSLVLFAHGYAGVAGDGSLLPEATAEQEVADQRSDPGSALSGLLGGPVASVADGSLARALILAPDYSDVTDYAPDRAAADLAAATTVVENALAAVLPAPLRDRIAYGSSEGGAATALMIEQHPGLVDDWVDQSGAVDAVAVRGQLETWTASNADALDLATAQTLLGRLAADLAPGDDDCTFAAVRAISPICADTGLSSLRRAVVVQSPDDGVVPLAVATRTATDLAEDGVATTTHLMDDSRCSVSMGLHDDGAEQVDARMEVANLLSPGGNAFAPGDFWTSPC